MGDGSVKLPPGFRFCPTEEELVLHFLFRKASLLPCHPDIIPDLDLCMHDPWELEGKALSSESLYYFFNKVTENRVTKSGYWKELQIDKPVLTSTGKKVGIKKYLLFCIGEGPAGFETAWIMHEYHLCNYGECSKLVLCRVRERKGNLAECFSSYSDDEDNGTELSTPDEMFLSIIEDDLDEISFARLV
ncbi:NAC domain-containing protein 104-like [Alnus glutinosa]|uniref:NAC domain-containing protein 104-like n=1 Tax=Alnus glutinosa TaxID=3517 RepID=UPI002D77BB91|nr:NAC domain-containing protein 104-like [Alnus glutinosa]